MDGAIRPIHKSLSDRTRRCCADVTRVALVGDVADLEARGRESCEWLNFSRNGMNRASNNPYDVLSTVICALVLCSTTQLMAQLETTDRMGAIQRIAYLTIFPLEQTPLLPKQQALKL